MNSPSYLPFIPANQPARTPLPKGSCDCHFHIFEGESIHPYATPRSYTPTPATQADHRQLCDTLGIERAVLVHPSVYGRDHQSFEDALTKNASWMRGVAVAYADSTEAQIAHWDALGARGTRCNALFAGGAALGELDRIADRVRPFGWHLQLLIDVSADPSALSKIVDLGLPVVVDHLGHVEADQALASPGFANMVSLLREGRIWVKLSGAYRVSAQRKGFSDVGPMAEALVQANINQLVWGSDWPHPAIAPPMPEEDDLVATLFTWLNEDERQKVLVDNPDRLYWSR
jgi:2-pyrone-4,6-dicarboxylate lactonase